MGENNSVAEGSRNRELVRQWAEAYAAGKDREACDLYADDVQYIPAITPQDVIIGRDVMLNASLEFRKSEPNYKMRINEIIAEKDKVVVTWTVTLSKGDVGVLGVFRLQNGKIVELQEYYTGDGFRLFGGQEPITEHK